MYPRVVINLRKFRNNIEVVNEEMNAKGISVFGVSKVFSGNPRIAKEYQKAGLNAIGESRIKNLKRLHEIDVNKVLLRIPMHSEIKEVVKYADISLNSELSTIELISEEAIKQGRVHGVILMVDFGDLREGIYEEEELYTIIEASLTLKGVHVMGIGTNLTCFGAVIPKISHMNKLVKLREAIKNKYNIELEYISGGNSSSYYLLEDEAFPKEINNLRIGEIFVCGRETAFGNQVKNTYDDVFVLEAEIIELKTKPSFPIGESGVDAFGHKPIYTDKGDMLRAICAVGRQDVGIDGLMLIDEGVEILGGSSDHMILDVSNSPKKYKIGDTIKFKLKYGGILGVMTSEYVKKIFIDE